VIASITGHRPEGIPLNFPIVTELRRAYDELGVTHVIQGMAAGVDLTSAYAAWLSQIPYTCAKPWSGHEPRVADRELYRKVIEHAAEVVNVQTYDKYPGAWVYQVRNEWMVDHAQLVIAVWDGSAGGTGNCVKYALKQKKHIYRINPKTGERSWLRGE
jgi:uncharacterized phage-like protein YoqJ